jgi:hypothetical protein
VTLEQVEHLGVKAEMTAQDLVPLLFERSKAIEDAENKITQIKNDNKRAKGQKKKDI